MDPRWEKRREGKKMLSQNRAWVFRLRTWHGILAIFHLNSLSLQSNLKKLKDEWEWWMNGMLFFCSQVHPFNTQICSSKRVKLPRNRTVAKENQAAGGGAQPRAATTGSLWWWLSWLLFVSLRCFVVCSSYPVVFAMVCPWWVILGLLSYLLWSTRP